MNRLIRLGDATSQWVNALIGGNPNESLSGRAWRTQSFWYKVIDAILFFDKDHCKTSHENDVAYAKWLIKGESVSA